MADPAILDYAKNIIDAPDEWSPNYTRAELLPMAQAYTALFAPRLFDDLPPEEQVKRLRYALETLVIWLVQAQTGFGEQDAEGIANLIQYGKTPPEVAA